MEKLSSLEVTSMSYDLLSLILSMLVVTNV